MSITEAEAKAKTDAAAAAAAKKDDGLVEVRKDGKKLRVHPTCVDDHVKIGWTK